MAIPGGPGTGKAAHGHTKWAYFHRIPVGYRTVPMRGPGGTVPPHAGQKVIIWGKGGWAKVGSPRFKHITSYIGPHGHQAVIASQYKVGEIRPDLRVPHTLPKSAQTQGSGNETAGRNGKGAPTQTTGPVKNPIGNQPGSHTAQHQARTNKQNQQAAGAMIGNPNVNQLQSLSAAKAMANAEFGAQISANSYQQQGQARQGAQDLADITNWYAALAKQNQSGAQANQAETQAAAGHVGNIVSSLIDQIGGAANPGSGTLANHATDAIQALLSAGAGQQAFEQNRASADTAAQLGQMGAQNALNSQAMTGLQEQLKELLGQRNAAVQTNRQQIIASNNAARQSNFGNSISRLDAILGAAQAAGNQRLQNIQIKQGQAQLPGKTNNGNPNFTPWDKLSTSGKLSAVNAMMGGDPSKTPYAVAVARGHAMGFSPTKFSGLLNTYYGK